MEGTNNMPIFSEGYKTKIILFLRVSRNNFLKESGKKNLINRGRGGILNGMALTSLVNNKTVIKRIN